MLSRLRAICPFRATVGYLYLAKIDACLACGSATSQLVLAARVGRLILMLTHTHTQTARLVKHICAPSGFSGLYSAPIPTSSGPSFNARGNTSGQLGLAPYAAVRLLMVRSSERSMCVCVCVLSSPSRVLSLLELSMALFPARQFFSHFSLLRSQDKKPNPLAAFQAQARSYRFHPQAVADFLGQERNEPPAPRGPTQVP